MEAKLSIGTARHHVNQEILGSKEFYGPHSDFESAIVDRISRGKQLKNPTGLMTQWRSIVSKFEGRTTNVVDYCSAVNYSASWVSHRNEIIISDDKRILSKVDEKLNICGVLASGISIGKHVLTTASVYAPIYADCHALARWFERQQIVDARLFEEELVDCLPLVALQLRIISNLKFVVGHIIPFGDGVLAGHCVESLSDPSYPTYGYLKHIERHKSNVVAAALPFGTITSAKNHKSFSSTIFRAQTFLGGHELKRYESVRESLIKWGSRNQGALKSLWPWLGLCVLLNRQLDLPPEVMPAYKELMDLMCSDEWVRTVLPVRCARFDASLYATLQ